MGSWAAVVKMLRGVNPIEAGVCQKWVDALILHKAPLSAIEKVRRTLMVSGLVPGVLEGTGKMVGGVDFHPIRRMVESAWGGLDVADLAEAIQLEGRLAAIGLACLRVEDRSRSGQGGE